jgi:hypothetical protein
MMVFIESQNTLHNTYRPLKSTVVTAYIPLFTKVYFRTHNSTALEHLIHDLEKRHRSTLIPQVKHKLILSESNRDEVDNDKRNIL